MISTLNLQLSKYGCPSAPTQQKGSNRTNSGPETRLERPGKSSTPEEDPDSPHASLSKTNSSPPHDLRLSQATVPNTPKLDLKKMSAATNKVLGTKEEDESAFEEFCELPSTPKTLTAKPETSTPETPTFQDMKLNYFKVLQPKPEGPVPIRSFAESPEAIPELTEKKSLSSPQDPMTPDLNCDLNTTTLMRASGPFFHCLEEESNDLQENPQTPEKSFHYDSDRCDDSGDDFDDILNLSLDAFSPPKTSKILQPRKTHSGASSVGWIPLVSDTEWRDAPVFLQKQATVEALNEALGALNCHIAKTPPARTDQRHIESLTTEELEKVIGKRCLETPAKVLTMGLVHLKRLDICTENSIKVYRIRRFY
jgi:hypothetical protein